MVLNNDVFKMETIRFCISELNSGCTCTGEFYLSISNVKSNENFTAEFRNEILPAVYKLFDAGTIKKDLFVLSVLSNEDKVVLSVLLDYERAIAKLNLNDSVSVFNFCFYHREHWLLNLFKSEEADYGLTTEVVNKLSTLRVIEITNRYVPDVQQVADLLKLTPSSSDPFINRYVDRVQRVLDILHFIRDVRVSVDYSDVYKFINSNSLLQTLSNYLDLGCVNIWNSVSHKLAHYEQDTPIDGGCTESEMFTAFTVIVGIMQCLRFFKTTDASEEMLQKEITNTIKTSKEKLLEIKSNVLQIEILENVFALIFIRDHSSKVFYCDTIEVRLILSFMESVIDELRKWSSFARNSNVFRRFLELSKYVSDACWRLALISDVKVVYNLSDGPNLQAPPKQILHYMLAPSHALINLCLKGSNLVKAHQVVKIFGLKSAHLANQVERTGKLTQAKQAVEKQLKNQKDDAAFKIRQIMEDYFNSCVKDKNRTVEDIIAKHLQEHSHLIQFTCEHEKRLDMFDIFLTVPQSYRDCQIILEAMEGGHRNNYCSSYSRFWSRILQVYHEDAVIPTDLLRTTCNYMAAEEYKCVKDNFERLSEAYDQLQSHIAVEKPGVLNMNHIAHKTFLQVQDICLVFKANEEKEQVKYMKKLLNYLRTLSKLLFVENNNSELISGGKEVTVFELLNKGRAKLIGELIYEKKLDAADLDGIFTKLKLNLMYHIAACSFPQINLNFNNDSFGGGQVTNHLLVPRKDVFNYIQKRNWLLAFILNKMHKVDYSRIDINEIRVKAFNNLIELSDTQKLKELYDNNDIITVLHHDYSSERIVNYFNENVLGPLDCAAVQNVAVLNLNLINLKLDSSQWESLYGLLLSLPQAKVHEDTRRLKDTILCKLSSDENDGFKYVQFIVDNNTRMKTLFSQIQNWPGELCVKVIKSELTRFDRLNVYDTNSYDILKSLCVKITLYNQMSHLVDVCNWYQIEQMCQLHLQEIFDRVLNSKNVELLIELIEVHNPQDELLLKISVDYMHFIFNNCTTLSTINMLLDKLPNCHAVYLCKNLLRHLKNLEQLEFTIDYLLMISSEDTSSLRNIQVALKIMTCFSEEDRDQLWSLIEEPLHIVEMQIMNTKLDKLEQVLDLIKSDLENADYDESELSVEKIDELLRAYAEKSLDFKVIACRPMRTPENKIMLSIDSVNLDKSSFVMPETVPDKTEWTSDDEVIECMCCRQIVFSMFNRRHHCRRCGRVICWNCSTKRMQVETYSDILVRVCVDCFEQTQSRSDSTYDGSSKIMLEESWILTNDAEHNAIVRAEFAFESAPSVSLCLSILKYHSKNEEYPKFLLNQCDNILKILQPVSQDCTVEVDYHLVIKMLRSLAVAAKMISNQCTLQCCTALADKVLSQAELLGLLVERDCLHLVPKLSQEQSPYINAMMLRKIRDKLLEQEHWNLALEVSTKAGLDNTVVFAVWGQSCLKAGNLQLARVKFQRCFEKTSYYDTSEFSSLNDLDASLVASKTRHLMCSIAPSVVSDKPFKNPPLLNEIVQILESMTTPISPKILKKLLTSKTIYESTTSSTMSPNLPIHYETSVCIMNKLKNLNAIMCGTYPSALGNASMHRDLNIHRPHLEKIFLDECIYYLNKYGTHLSLCQFYMRHGRFEEILYYIIESHVNVDVFIEIYMLCLKEGLADVLQDCMINIDSTFDVWKDYLRNLCIHLEKQSMLNSLYQLQQFMGDFVRAAVTCLKFYSNDATTFQELSSRNEFLYTAGKHLNQELEQQQWVEVSQVRKLCSTVQDAFEAKPITNPDLVMKMESKDVDRHIKTVTYQIEIVNFLARCETEGRAVIESLHEIMLTSTDKSPTAKTNFKLPTLFGPTNEKILLAVLTIVCGNDVADGFGLAYRIIQEYKLKSVKVYCQAGRQLAKNKRYSTISQLVNCIHNTGERDAVISEMCDEMLVLVARTLGDNDATDQQLEDIIKLISDRTIKINSYIETKQLRSAFLVAAKLKRFGDIHRISREAELLNKPDVKKMCQKYLLTHPHVSPPRNEVH